MNEQQKLTCRVCGGDTTVMTAWFDLGRCAHPCRSEIEKATNHPDSVRCSLRCQRQGAARTMVRRTRCAVCSTAISLDHLYANGVRVAGRVPSYCSEKCRKHAQREREKAMRELARDSFAGDLLGLEAQRVRAVALLEAWSGRGPSPVAAPSPDARVALRRRCERLGELLKAAHAARWQEQQRELAAGRGEVWKQRQAAAAAADREWREQVLADAPRLEAS